jgi:hypothetical protein
MLTAVNSATSALTDCKVMQLTAVRDTDNGERWPQIVGCRGRRTRRRKRRLAKWSLEHQGVSDRLCKYCGLTLRRSASGGSRARTS